MTFFICTNCGYGSASWLGRCPDCGEFKTLKEAPSYITGSDKSVKKEEVKKLSATPFKKIPSLKKDRLKSGIFELDRVLGGGIIPGETILLTGEPGVGKSTLLLQSLAKLNPLYISGEESAEQVKDRAERLNIKLDNFLFSETLQVEGITEGLEDLKNKIDILVVDSIQTVYSKSVDGTPGSITQLKESTMNLITIAKKMKIGLIIVGHITKGGEIAGPKTFWKARPFMSPFESRKE